MKLQPESKKELTRIACGTAICTAALWVAFAALHLVGWVKFDYTVVLGSLIGAAVAIVTRGNSKGRTLAKGWKQGAPMDTMIHTACKSILTL